MTNVTISENHSTAVGSMTSGGVVVKATVVDTFTNDTIAWNTGGTFDGIVVTGTGAKAPQLKNTIVGDPTTRTVLCSRRLTSMGHNIDTGDSCGFIGAGDKVNTDPMLNPVGDNGGGNYTMLLRPGAPWPAIDAGDSNGCPGVDARWVRRTQDGNGSGGENCDIGSYESSSTFKDVQIGITMTPSTMTPHPGDIVIYTIALTNGGPFDSVNSWVIGTLPSQVTILSCTNSDGTRCTIDGSAATTIFPILGLANLPTMSITAQVGPNVEVGTVLKGAAATWSDNPDDNHNNNKSTAEVTVG
jgi:uncharacterized repeat protein (TIGR01451 family)